MGNGEGTGGRRRVGKVLAASWWPTVAVLGWSFAGIFGLLTVVQTVKLDRRHFHVEWGTFYQAIAAIGAVGTVGTLIATLTTLILNERRRAEADRRQQAELISGWIRPPNTTGVANIGLSNASHGVAYEIYVDISCIPAPDKKDGITPPLSAIPDDRRRARARAHSLPPGRPSFGNLELANGLELANEMMPDKIEMMPDKIEIYFKDFRGAWWRRTASGGLEASSRPEWADSGVWRVKPLVLTQPLR
jgi:hypothetical protein